jgi:chromosome segregation ATPase
MEFEQIIKRLDWLDEEQRKGKNALAAIEERLSALDTSLKILDKRLKALEKSVPGASTAAARFTQLEQLMVAQRTDFGRSLDELEKKIQSSEAKLEKQHQAEIAPIQDALTEMRLSIEKLQELRRDIQARVDEETRLSKAISDIKSGLEEAVRTSQEAQRITNLAEESRRQDAKRLIDLQGELSALRKRLDDLRGKIEASNDAFRHIDARVNELLASETERKQAQTAFLEQQALAQVERERVWKEMREKYEAFRQQTELLDAQLQELDSTHRALKRAQEAHEELNQKIERRINEITEMQRLAEDRIRQEWITFKADDQKRWTGFSLSQDEALKELHKDIERMEERLTSLDDAVQTLHDQIEQTTDTTERQMEELMNWAHEWLTAYERIMGHSHTTR